MKVNKKFEGSEWEEKIKKNPDFYRFFQSKVDEYMNEKEKWLFETDICL